ncbi:peptidylprolyl isomerase [Clostridium tagluense]|nr:peptidylprolyl isomerase [Clostridium tagluense]MCB2315181.1 peptidylprolyl isomerase [Clostridium tagluense]MCB2319877.1 peptidylprolyl isomerase [Clostridium tagluense]MCB2324924.1 peptidylprolyl isomerase [Clostridium tagluense]MCB2329622.1 peptidylprolyl isomerase [Clostridium tagluense]
MKTMKFLKRVMALFTLVFVVFLGGCTNKEQVKVDSTPPVVEKVEPAKEIKTEKTAKDKNPLVTIEMENGSIIRVELYPEIAPNTVRNFVSLVQKGYYNGLIFHRVIPGFMIQGGDPNGTGSGGPGYSIAGEFSSNGFENSLKHERGVISMARGEDNNSAGSQFFIVVKDSSFLDTKYAAFGKVTEGMETADKIVAVETEQKDQTKKDKPIKDQKMKKVTVDTFGVKYGEVEKAK